jgi:hypothetical protein
VDLNPTPQKIIRDTRRRLDSLGSPRGSPVSDNASMVAMLNNTLELDPCATFASVHQLAHWTFTEKDLQTFERFQHRTVMTIGTKRGAPVYRHHIGPMAFMVRSSSLDFHVQIHSKTALTRSPVPISYAHGLSRHNTT